MGFRWLLPIGIAVIVIVSGCTTQNTQSDLMGSFYSALEGKNTAQMKALFDSDYVGRQVENNMLDITDSLGDFKSYKVDSKLTAAGAGVLFLSYRPYFDSGEWAAYKINGSYEKGSSTEVLVISNKNKITQWVLIGSSVGSVDSSTTIKEELQNPCLNLLTKNDIATNCGIDFTNVTIYDNTTGSYKNYSETEGKPPIDRFCFKMYTFLKGYNFSTETTVFIKLFTPFSVTAEELFNERLEISRNSSDTLGATVGELHISGFDAFYTVYKSLPHYSSEYQVLVKNKTFTIHASVETGAFENSICKKDFMEKLTVLIAEKVALIQ
jgi:hypothetical protein